MAASQPPLDLVSALDPDRAGDARASAPAVPRWIDLIFVAAFYCAATALTGAAFAGDTIDYALAIADPSRVDPKEFWDFGHLLWRPAGWLFAKAIAPLTAVAAGADPLPNVWLALQWLNWAAGLATIFLLHALLRGVGARRWPAHLVTAAFVVGNGMLNYAHSGCAYTPGLAMLTLGLWLTIRAARDPAAPRARRAAVLAGLALAGALFCWLLYALVVPAVLVSPLFLCGAGSARRRLVLRSATTFTLAVGSAYLATAAALGLRDLAGVREWVAASSHGVTQIGGIARVVFGLPRSFIDMGNDGVLFKRFLVHDPYAPVSAAALVTQSLWKLAFFYLVCAGCALSLLRSAHGRRVFALLVTGAIPVFGFAMFWQGGDLERYFPLYPFLAIGLAVVLSNRATSRVLKGLIAALAATAAIANMTALSTHHLTQHRARAAARVSGLTGVLPPNSRVFTVTPQDELAQWFRNAPAFAPGLRINPLLVPGTTQIATWHQAFAADARAAWDAGGEVWVTQRVLAPQPLPQWNWVEGADRRVSWRAIDAFFRHLETGSFTGGDDGFVRLPPSILNRRQLESLDAAPLK